METCTNYKGYLIRYVQFTGTTYVEDCFGPLTTFPRLGCLEGEKRAKTFIDDLG